MQYTPRIMRSLRFVVLCRGLVLSDVIHIIAFHLTGTRAIVVAQGWNLINMDKLVIHTKNWFQQTEHNGWRFADD